MDNLAGNSKARQMMKTEDPGQAPLLSKSQKEAAIRERSIAYKKAKADKMKGQKPKPTKEPGSRSGGIAHVDRALIAMGIEKLFN